MRQNSQANNSSRGFGATNSIIDQVNSSSRTATDTDPDDDKITAAEAVPKTLDASIATAGGGIWRPTASIAASSSPRDHPLAQLGLHLQRRSQSDQLSYRSPYHSSSLGAVLEDVTHQDQQASSSRNISLSSRVIGPSRSFASYTYTVEDSRSITGSISVDPSSRFDSSIFRNLPTDTGSNSSLKMAPRSPMQADQDESDEFAPISPGEPLVGDSDLTQLQSMPEEADQSSLSLGDVDASRISAGSQGHTVVIPAPPVSRNLTDAFDICDGVEGDDHGGSDNHAIVNTPSPSLKIGGGNKASNDIINGDSPDGVEQLDVEGLTISGSKGAATTVLKTPRSAAPQDCPTKKVGSSPRIKDFGETVPFSLHPILALDLPATTVNRVSFYSVMHDINKDASGMAANDPARAAGGRPRASSDAGSSVAGSMSTLSGVSSNGGEPPKDEEFSPLIIAVNGPPPGLPMNQTVSKISTATTAASSTQSIASVCETSAVIDEEKWLLRAVSARSEAEVEGVGGSCPPTFAQAIGEQESLADDNGSVNSHQAPNPMAELSQSRTQLWKPSRSWWEAKSGKNPWIEPTSHNKRWRYLWPLIHYHKFLAKCIKKLKRNGVDVKTSVSPVSAFLRTEVCAVSDHLARCSYFTSEEWTGSLQFFDGWTDFTPEAEEALRSLILKQQLRSLGDPADTDSPLLRDQIDGRFLKAMAAARSKQPTSTGDTLVSNGGSFGKTRPSPMEGRPPMAPGGGLPRSGGRPPVSAISTSQQQASSGRKSRRGKRGRRGSRASDGDASMSSRGSSTGEEGAAWNGIPPSSPHPPPHYGDPSIMQGGNYGNMPPPYGFPYGMYGHSPYYPHPAHGMAPPVGHGPPTFYGQHPPNPQWGPSAFGHGPPPEGHPHTSPPPYPMQMDPNMSLDMSFHGGLHPDGMLFSPHPPVPGTPGTPNQSLDHGPDMSMASPAWAHLDRLATGLIATPSTNRSGRARQAAVSGGPRPNIKDQVAGAARSLVFGEGNAPADGIPPSPATLFNQSKSPMVVSHDATNPNTTVATADVPAVSRSSPPPEDGSIRSHNTGS